MKKMKLITKRKWDKFQPNEKFWYCTGAKGVYEDDFKESGYNFIEWETNIKELPIEKIKLLNLVPSKPHLKKEIFPKFLSILKNLEHISFDLMFLRKEEIEKLPTSVRSVILSRDSKYADVWNQDNIEWDENTCLENLEALLIIADEEKTKLINHISQETCPKLNYLGFRFSNKEELDVFSRFSNLTDLELSYLREYPIFEYIKHLPIFSLDITGTNNKFALAEIQSLKNLQYLRLNGVRSEIDCQIFTELPKLEEIVILNSKKILNIQALLECKNLVSVSFLDCGNPFKKGIVENFNNKNYEILDIMYA